MGGIEEIGTTYVVVRIWDLRRLILPISYLIEHPFENWTRKTADLLGTVFIYADYTVPVEEVRQELHRILESSPLWDQKVWGLQITNATEQTLGVARADELPGFLARVGLALLRAREAHSVSAAALPAEFAEDSGGISGRLASLALAGARLLPAPHPGGSYAPICSAQRGKHLRDSAAQKEVTEPAARSL